MILILIDPKWSDPFPDPAQAGATCTGLPFLKYNVRVIVVVQRPADSDAAYPIAVVQEEMEEFDADFYSPNRRSSVTSSSYCQSKKASTRIPG